MGMQKQSSFEPAAKTERERNPESFSAVHPADAVCQRRLSLQPCDAADVCDSVESDTGRPLSHAMFRHVRPLHYNSSAPRATARRRRLGRQ